MTSSEGGFFSAEDADSEGEEGKFYVWTEDEVKSILGESDGTLFSEVYNFSKEGNFREESTGHSTEKNIPHLTNSIVKVAQESDMETSELKGKLEKMRQKLFDTRDKRVHPLKDDKILTDWNGLMIAAFAKGAQVLNDDSYAQAAGNAADFVLENLKGKDGRLLKRYRKGKSSLPAHLEDYAFLSWGLLELYEATFDVKYLSESLLLTETMTDLFWDETNGAFFFTADDGEEQIVRTKELYDGAIPSGNSVAALVLLRLGRITGKSEYENMAATIGKLFSENVEKSPTAFTQLLLAVDFGIGPSYEIVVVGDRQSEDTRSMLRRIQESFLPNKVVILKPSDSQQKEVVRIAPFTETQVAMNGKTTVYVCQNYACKSPTTEITEMMSFLQ